MDRLPHQHHIQADPFAKPDRDLAPAETDIWSDPWGLDLSPEEAAVPKSTNEIREVLLGRRNGGTSSAGASVPVTSRLLTAASRGWARVQSLFPLDRRVVAGLGLLGVAGALLIGVSRYDLAPSIKTVSGTTYNAAVGRLSSAAGAALDLVGQRPVAPVKTEAVAAISRKKVPSVRPTTGKRGPVVVSPALQPVPHSRDERVPAFRDERVPAFRDERFPANKEALALLEDNSAVETSIVYSQIDTDVKPPVAIRSPGIATDRGIGDKHASLIEILVSETGRVESARGWQRPSTLGAVFQSSTALSAVKTWRFWPARKNGQAVKYRVIVPFVETLNPAGTLDGTR